MSEGLNLLASILEQGSMVTFRSLQEDMFVDDDELFCYEFIRNHIRRHRQLPDVDTMIQEAELEIDPTPEPVQYYMDKVYDRYLYNQMSPVFNEMRESLTEMRLDDIRDGVGNMNRIIHSTNRNNDLLNIGEVGENIYREYREQRLDVGISGVPSGHSLIDEQTGGYQNGDLAVYVARPKQGKTWMLIKQAHHAWQQGYNILFVTMEMTLNQIGNRFYGLHAGVNPRYIRKRTLTYHAERRVRRAIDSLQGSNRFNMLAGNMGKTVSEIEMTISQLNPDLIVIDGFYLMRPSYAPRNAGRFERIAYILDELKQITITSNRPVLGSTQFGRAAGKAGQKGSLENIGFTDAIGTHASLIYSVRPGIGADPDTKILELLAGREGETNRVLVNYKFAPINFDQIREISDEEMEKADSDSNKKNKKVENMSWMKRGKKK